MAIKTTPRDYGAASTRNDSSQKDATLLNNKGQKAADSQTGTAKIVGRSASPNISASALQQLDADREQLGSQSDKLHALINANASVEDITAAKDDLNAARSAYQQHLSDIMGPKASRSGRSMNGADQPMPDTGMIPSQDTGLGALLAGLDERTSTGLAGAPKNADAVGANAAEDVRSSLQTIFSTLFKGSVLPGSSPSSAPTPSTQGTTPASQPTSNPSTAQPTAPTTTTTSPTAQPTTKPASKVPGTVVNVDPGLSQEQQAHLADASQVLPTATITETLRDGTQVPVKSGDLSGSFSLFPFTQPVANDINQKLSDDCYWLSALSSMASTTQGQATIEKAISGPSSKNGDYVVTLYAPNGKPVDIAVNPNNLPKTSSGAPAFNGSARDGGKANWANLMEAAYAKYNDVYGTNTFSAGSGVKGYDGVMFNGIDDTSFNYALTGKASTAYPISGASNEDVAAKLQASLAQGKPVEAYNLDTADTEVLPSHIELVPAHAYAVLAVTKDANGELQVTLRNPWGNNYPEQTKGQKADGSFTISMEEFNNSFEQINV